MRIAVAGRGPLADAVLHCLADGPHTIAAVLWNGRRRNAIQRLKTRAFEITRNASLARVPVIWFRLGDARESAHLSRLNVDLLISAGFDCILRPEVLRVPAIGCVNIHPSLLPRHRGPNPLAHVVLAADEESGITYHWMDEDVDTGHLIAQFRHAVRPADSARDLLRIACRLVHETLQDALNSASIHSALPQAGEATYAGWLSEKELTIDWHSPAQDIDRLIRAAPPYACAQFRRGNRLVHVEEADVDLADPGVEPGIVVRSGPQPAIAAAGGTITIRRARVIALVSFPWPSPWNAPRRGERIR